MRQVKEPCPYIIKSGPQKGQMCVRGSVNHKSGHTAYRKPYRAVSSHSRKLRTEETKPMAYPPQLKIVSILMCEHCEKAIKADQSMPIEVSTGRIRITSEGSVNTSGMLESRVVIHQDCLLGYARAQHTKMRNANPS